MDRIEKNAVLKSLTAGEKDLELINKYTLEPLTADKVFTFKVTLGNNDIDDRNFMPFSKNALEDLAGLYPGRTVIKNHDGSADNQIARIYDTALKTDENKITALGEPYTELTAKCYMARTSENAGLIDEIKAGIKKEVSTGFAASKIRCSICGKEKYSCTHIRGYDYKGAICMHIIESCPDAYELSFVAVPAQPNAGTRKKAEVPDISTDDRKTALQKMLDESREKYKIE